MEPWDAAGLDDARTVRPAPLPASDDVLVFARTDTGWELIGGSGRGASWAGIVAVRFEDEPLLARAWESGRPVRISSSESARVAGPYWSNHAAAIPVGHHNLVVVGSSTKIGGSDASLVRAAADVVASHGGVPPAKLLADELELVHAVRQLMDHRPERVTETVQHITAIAAQALSCEVGATLVSRADRVTVGAIGVDDATDVAHARLVEDLVRLHENVRTGPRLEQEPPFADGVWRDAVVSRLALPIGRPDRLGLLVLGHSTDNPRGFTGLCQRIGRALAEASELLISQALAREELAAERDLLAQIARTDPLTGLDNRTAWDEAVRAETARMTRTGSSAAVVSADIDGLKQANDRHGHPAGDRLIRAAGTVLRVSARISDRVARVGGDEFLVLLPETDERGARRFVRRVRRAAELWRDEETGARLVLSLGAAVAGPDTAVAAAVEAADRRMYRQKRSRVRRPNLT